MLFAAIVRIVRDPSTISWDRVNSRLDVDGAAFIVNRSDRSALELAARLSGTQGFIAIGCGHAAGLPVFKEAAAFGASRLLYRSFEADRLLGAQALLADSIGEERPDVVLVGQTALDTNDAALAGALGELLGGDSCGDVVDATFETSDSLLATLGDGSMRRLALPVSLAVLPITARKISPLAMMKATRATVAVTRAERLAATVTLRAVANGVMRRRSLVLDEGDAAAAAFTAVSLLRERRAL